MAEFQLAWPIEPVDTDALIERWASWLADAAQGRLHPPQRCRRGQLPGVGDKNSRDPSLGSTFRIRPIRSWMVPRGGIEPPTLRFSVTISTFS